MPTDEDFFDLLFGVPATIDNDAPIRNGILTNTTIALIRAGVKNFTVTQRETVGECSNEISIDSYEV